MTNASKSLQYSETKIQRPQIREFCACIFYRLSHSMLRQNRQKCATFCPLSFCRKGLTALQRGYRCIAAVAPLPCNGSPVVGSGGPRWSAAECFWDEKGSGM